MRPEDDGLCWLCDNPLDSDRAATSWHGFGAHRECARQEDERTNPDASVDSGRVIRTNT
jgi:hypothetical protein